MWVLYAFGSALFAGLTAILAKCGIRKTDSTVATAIRTIVVLAFSWGMVFLVGSEAQLAEISGRTLLFLVLSGLATGASWLCYFRALQIGDGTATLRVLRSAAQWHGVTYKEDKPALMAAIEKMIADGKYPKNLWA